MARKNQQVKWIEEWGHFPSSWHRSVRRDINFRQSVRQTNKQTQGIICRYVIVVLPLMVKERISMPIRPTSGAATSRTSEANWSRSRYTCATDNNKQKRKNRNKWKCKSLSNSAGKIKMQTNPGYQNTIDSCPVEFTTIRDSRETPPFFFFKLILILSCPFYCGCAVAFVLV